MTSYHIPPPSPEQQAWIDQYNAANPFTTNYLQDQQNLYNQQYADWERNNPVPIQTQWDYWTEQVPIRRKAFEDASHALSMYQRSESQGPGWAYTRLPWNHPLKRAVLTAYNKLNIAYDRRKYWGKTDPSTTPERAPPPKPLSTNIRTSRGVLNADDRPDWEKFGDIAFDPKTGAPYGWNTPWVTSKSDPNFTYQKSYSTRYQQPDKSYFTRVIGDVPESVMDEWYEHQWNAQQSFWDKFSARSNRVKSKTFKPWGGTTTTGMGPSGGWAGPRIQQPFAFGANRWEERRREMARERWWGEKWMADNPDWGDRDINWPRWAMPWGPHYKGGPFADSAWSKRPGWVPSFSDPSTWGEAYSGRWKPDPDADYGDISDSDTTTSPFTLGPGGRRNFAAEDFDGPPVYFPENGDTESDPVGDSEGVIRNSFNKPRPTSQTFK